MKIKIKIKIKKLSITFSFLTISIFALSYAYSKNKIENDKLLMSRKKESIRNILTKKIVENDKLPRTIRLNEEDYYLDYNLDYELQTYIVKLLKGFRTDYSSIVVIDNQTGNILSMVGMKKGGKQSFDIPLSTTHPSASLIKIVTSADLLENSDLEFDSKILFNGKGTTLYKNQLKNKKNKWTRFETLKRAFAKSNNVVFGKAAINYSNGSSLYKTATDFGFNDNISSDLKISSSIFNIPKSQYNLAELASGFNKQTLISPIHAVMLSQIIANDGVLVSPNLTDHVLDSSGNSFSISVPEKKRVISVKTARDVKDMMESTARRGTARSLYYRTKRSLRSRLKIGAKTGSITGGIPYGKRDWISVFAEDELLDKRISIAVMNVNVKHWHVKSSYLARKVIEFYFTKELKETEISGLEKQKNSKFVRL